MYYAYNFAVMVAVFALFRKRGDNFIVFTRNALIAAVVLELIATVALPNVVRGIRTVGTFNNPNQLGYWTILVSATYLLTLGSERLKYRDVGILCILGYVSTLSLSKAAMGSYLVLLASALWLQGASARAKFVLGAVFGIGTIVFVSMSSDGLEQDTLLARALQRFQEIGTREDNTAAGRGYENLAVSPVHDRRRRRRWLRSLRRRRRRAQRNALDFRHHPVFLWDTRQRLVLDHALDGFSAGTDGHLIYFVPICLYGLTHQGLRASLLWVFLGLVYALARHDANGTLSARPGGAPGS